MGQLGLVDLPQGDPGLLVRQLWPAARQRKGVVLVPHFSAFGIKTSLSQIRAAKALGWTIVPPTRPADEVCQTIAEADLVVTSSLHGQVVAHATDTPVLVTTFQGHGDPQFKYADYLSVFGLTPRPVPMASLITGLKSHRQGAEADARLVSGMVDPIVESLTQAASRLA
jgi:hypothetical protein